MEARTVQFTLPADLVDQLEEAGLLEDVQRWERLFKDELKREAAFRQMEATFTAFDQLPDEMKPSEDEILATIKEVRAERHTGRENRS